MPYGTHMHLFKTGIKPVWEDPAFVNGCQLEIKSQKQQTSKFWEDLILAMMGEQFEEENFIAGMVMKLKPQFDKIAIWMVDASNEKAIKSVKDKVIEILQVEEAVVEYASFESLKNMPQPQKFNKNKRKKPDGTVP